MRLAWKTVSRILSRDNLCSTTHVFDIGAWVDRDDVAVLDPQVVTDHAVEADTAVIKIIIGENDQNCVLSLLSSYENCVTTEELESLHGVVGECDNGVVIVDGIGNPVVVSFRSVCPRFTVLTSAGWASSFS
jgi:hypothetical protein